jgi:heme-degrading monooxygenase HmoA
MAFLSIHTMSGDPEDLLARKRQHMDPVVERLAPGFGAIASMTSKTASGIITINLWATADGAAAFSRHEEALQAQRASGLPMPATFERFSDAEYTLYGQE